MPVAGTLTEEKRYKLESIAAMWKRLGWRFHVAILAFVIAVSIPVLSWWPSYYWSVLRTSFAIASIIFRFWLFSRRTWFWMTVAVLTMLQGPLVVALHNVANRYKGSFAFFLILVDFLVMNTLVRWVSPELRRNPQATPN